MVIAVALAGCVDSGSVVCGDTGLVCPAGTSCAAVTDPDVEVCADERCDGLGRFARCDDGRRCYDGVCLPVACGNGRIDRADPNMPGDVGEACDDGNDVSGDGCSSDCRSDETCGNGTVDTITAEQCDDSNRLGNDGCDSQCQPERARWLVRATVPARRTGSAIAYDVARDRTVMFGGTADQIAAATDDTWEGTEAGWSQQFPLAPPPARTGAAMAYDAARRRVVMYGGEDSSTTWLWDGATWTAAQAQDEQSRPPPRADQAMAYDSARRVVVMFGGHLPAFVYSLMSDTWEWDGTTWTNTAPSSPPPERAKAAMAYDPSRAVTVMCCGGAADDHVYEYDGHAWQAIAPVGVLPPRRVKPSLAFDPVTRRILLVGGTSMSSGAELGDAWSWDAVNHAWSPIPSPQPQLAAGHLMTTDARRGQVRLVGYSQPVTFGPGLPSTWVWDGQAWQRSTQTSAAMIGSVRATTDPLRAKIVAMSTTDGSLFELDGNRWRTAAGPLGRVDGAIAYDAAHRYALAFGGTIDKLSTDATWSWDGTAWHDLAPPVRPPPRDSAMMAFSARESRVVMFGGQYCDGTACTPLNDTWEWDGTTWHEMHPETSPPPRVRGALAYDPIRQAIVLFGGVTDTMDRLDDLWVWNGSTWTEQFPIEHGPAPREAAGFAWDATRQRLVLHGGVGRNGATLGDVRDWDGTTWTAVDTAIPIARSGHAMVPNIGPGLVAIGSRDDAMHPLETDLLRWDGNSPTEACRSNVDDDGDGAAGCDDLDCWWACWPLCPPGAPCDPTTPHCGDGVCNTALEDCRICPDDCKCAPICGDAICDLNETDCPGDCP